MAEQHQSKVSFIHMLAYAAPACASYFFLNPTWFILPGVYAKYFGLELTAIASVLLLSRTFDAITDPGIGYLSDRHSMAGGSRKLWVVIGGLCLITATYFLFTPPQGVTSGYYLVCSLAFFLAYTAMEIPHVTWGSEITTDYNLRAKVYSFRATFIYLGQVTFFGLPLLPIYETNEYTPQVLKDAVYIGAVVMIVSLIFSASQAPAGSILKTRGQDDLQKIVRSIVTNKPLLLFFTGYLFSGLSFGMWVGLLFFYLDSYLALSGKIAVIFLIGNILGLVSIPFWLKLIVTTNKSVTWAVSMVTYSVLLICNLYIEPGMSWWFTLMFTGGIYVCFACLFVSAPSILGDIIDYGKMKFNKDRGATYYALVALIYKISLALGSSFALVIVGYFGIDLNAATQTSEAVLGLRLGFIIIPAIFGIIALFFIVVTPINKYRHFIICRRLEKRIPIVEQRG